MKLSQIFSFRKVDEIIFKSVNELKDGGLAESVSNFVDRLEGVQKRYFIKFISVFIVVLPLLIVLIMVLDVRGNIQEKRNYSEIIDLINKIEAANISMKSGLTQNRKSKAFQSQVSLQGELSNLLRQRQLDASKVKIENFAKDQDKSGITKALVTLSFDKLMAKDLPNFIRLLGDLRASITTFDVEKDKSDLLKGMAQLEVIVPDTGEQS